MVVDEAYGEFSREESALSLLAEHPNLLLLRTFSKAFGLAGLRLGYLIGSPEVIREIVKARVPFMVDRLSEIGCIGAPGQARANSRARCIPSARHRMALQSTVRNSRRRGFRIANKLCTFP